MATAPMFVTINGGQTTTGGAPLTGSQPYTQLIAFGDSTIDSGYFFTHRESNDPNIQALYDNAVQAGGGLPTDPKSLMNSTLLAQQLGVTAIPVGEAGGTNYAAFGATITGALQNSLAPSIQTQVQTYLSDANAKADPNALYIVSGGGNDSIIANKMNTTAEAQAYMRQQADTLAASIKQIHDAGARYFLVNSNAGKGGLKAIFDDRLWADLSSAGIPFAVNDASNLIRAIDANPSSYGITNTVQPPNGPFSSSNPYSASNGGSVINPDPSNLPGGWARFGTQDVSSTAANTYLWADNEHLSGKGQSIEASYEYNVLQNAVPLPSEVLHATPIVFGEGSTFLPNVSYQWQRVQAGQTAWTNISGATSSAYTVIVADVGYELRVESLYRGANGDTASAVSPASYAVACYAAGTLIATERGDLAVETLQVGDPVVTVSGACRPVRWIGWRHIDIARHAKPDAVRPIRIEADALGEGLPRRDLLLSPDHALWLNGALVPARDLVNGATIRQDARASVLYVHIELDTHDVVLAEGVAAESYRDCDNRDNFENAPGGLVRLHADWGRSSSDLPVATSGLVEQLRAAFAERARQNSRGEAVWRHDVARRARARATRTNWVRNPRAEGIRRGRIDVNGCLPTHWWATAPAGVVIACLGSGEEDGLPFVDLRLSGRSGAAGFFALYPEPGRAAAATVRQSWTVSCYARRLGPAWMGAGGLSLSIDEYGSDGSFKRCQADPKPLPGQEGLAFQRLSATRHVSHPDAAFATGYLRIDLMVQMPIDVTLRLAGPQIECGDYASDLILPMPGSLTATTRQRPSLSVPATNTRRSAAIA